LVILEFVDNKMSRFPYVVLLGLVFLLGILLTSYYYTSSSYISGLSTSDKLSFAFSSTFLGKSVERDSPSDHITPDMIHVYDDVVLIDLEGTRWSSFTDTNSMDPLLDEYSNGLERVPASPDELDVGDVVSYSYGDSIIIHRIVEIGEDDDGWYARTKGDNNPSLDPHIVRFDQIEGVLVGILY